MRVMIVGGALLVSLSWGEIPESCKLESIAEVQRLRSAFNAELQKFGQEFDAALQPLVEGYIMELRKLAVKLSGSQDTHGVESVRKEAARIMQAMQNEPDPFEVVPEMPEEAVNREVESLRLLQEDYIARRTTGIFARNERVTALTERYIAGLEKLATLKKDGGRAVESVGLTKEARRLRVVMQRKDCANRILEEARVQCAAMPAPPDLSNLKRRATTPSPATRNLSALTINDLPPIIQSFLMQPLEYDREWPPEITKWRYEGSGNYAHDFALFKIPGMPDELGIFVLPKTMRAYVRGTIRHGTVNVEGKAVNWLGKGMSWRLNDSRDLVCRVIFRTKRPALSAEGGPAACLAVYSIDEQNHLIASMSVPMQAEETRLLAAKHYTYNRMNIVWEGSKRKRGFTIPNHMPIRVVAAIAGFAPGEEVDATIEIAPCPQLGDAWQ